MEMKKATRLRNRKGIVNRRRIKSGNYIRRDRREDWSLSTDPKKQLLIKTDEDEILYQREERWKPGEELNEKYFGAVMARRSRRSSGTSDNVFFLLPVNRNAPF